MTKQYQVTGMDCAACVSRVEKAVGAVPGIVSCRVSLFTNTMTVEGSVAESQIAKAVKAAGYGIVGEEKREEGATDTATRSLWRRLSVSTLLLLPLLYLGMLPMFFTVPIPETVVRNTYWIQAVLAGGIILANGFVFTRGVRAICRLSPTMDSLIAMGAGVSYVWSLYLYGRKLFGEGEMAAMPSFDSAGMILTILLLGKCLESRAKGATSKALYELLELAPKEATRVSEDGREEKLLASELEPGELFRVRPGEAIPVDGEVVSGSSSVQEAFLTGESIPADKEPGGKVYAATMNVSGSLLCRAERTGKETSLAKIVQFVTEATTTKAPIARLADRVSAVFVPLIFGIALVTMVVWLLVGADGATALRHSVAVLLVSCPCSLGLATPVVIMVASGVGAKNGILFKDAATIEEIGKADYIVLDKTGTVTYGKPSVTELLPAAGETAEELLKLAASLEKESEHPLARAIVEKAGDAELYPVKDFKNHPGNGITAQLCVDGGRVRVAAGKRSFIEQVTEQSETEKQALQAQLEVLAEQGKTPLVFAKEGRVVGVIALADKARAEAAEVIAELKKSGLQAVLLTGDHRKTAEAIGRELGIRNIVAEVLPDEKERVVRKLLPHGKVIMVGDGINDAPSLARADVGIAIGAGTDVAIEAAKVVLLNNDLRSIPAALRLGRAAMRTICENLGWGFCYNLLLIPLAAGIFEPICGWSMHPVAAAAAMGMSDLCIIINALKLRRFRFEK